MRSGALRTWTARTGLLVAVVALAATARFLLDLRLAPAPPLAPARWAAWWSERPVIDSAVALARPVALSGLTLLAVVTVLALITARRAPRTPARWQRLVPRAVGASLLSFATAVIGPAGAGATDDSGGTVSSPPATVVVAAASPGAVTPPIPSAPIEPPPATRLPWATPVAPTPVPPISPVTVVGPGDHLWSIAEEELARVLDRPPEVAEIDPYWRAVVEANRDRLVEPDNADLVLPGQEIVLPPL